MNKDMNLAMVGSQYIHVRKAEFSRFLLLCKYSSIYLNFISDMRIHKTGLPLLSHGFSEMPSSAISPKITSLAMYNSTVIGK